MREEPDLLVIGGGIVGAFTARDAAGRGMDVVLCDERDLASGTTSRSSRLIHGGLRYLEHMQIGLVYDSLRERKSFLRAAPELVEKRRFYVPTAEFGRSRLALRAGLFLYDLLAGTRDVRAEDEVCSYTDGFCEPEQLTVQAALDAAARGAEIRTYCAVTGIDRSGVVRFDTGEECRPRAIVAALGPWTDRVLAKWNLAPGGPLLRPTRGTHVLLDYPLDKAYFLEARSDGRIFFALPMWGRTLVGTTDLDDLGDPREAVATDSEIEYLTEEAARRLPVLRGASVRGAWTGHRPLVHSRRRSSARSRSERYYRSPVLPKMYVCLGGKLTTARLMAERVLDRVEGRIFRRKPRRWTANASLRVTNREAYATGIRDLLFRRSLTAFSGTVQAMRMEAEAFALKKGIGPARFEEEWREFLREARRIYRMDLL